MIAQGEALGKPKNAGRRKKARRGQKKRRKKGAGTAFWVAMGAWEVYAMGSETPSAPSAGE